MDDVGPYEFCQTPAGELMRRVADHVDENGVKMPTFQQCEFKSAKDRLRVTAMLRVKRVLASLINAEQGNQPDANLRALRADLNATYDRFTADFGPFHASKNKSVLGEDPRYYRLRALELDYIAPISATVAEKRASQSVKSNGVRGICSPAAQSPH